MDLLAPRGVGDDIAARHAALPHQEHPEQNRNQRWARKNTALPHQEHPEQNRNQRWALKKHCSSTPGTPCQRNKTGIRGWHEQTLLSHTRNSLPTKQNRNRRWARKTLLSRTRNTLLTKQNSFEPGIKGEHEKTKLPL